MKLQYQEDQQFSTLNFSDVMLKLPVGVEDRPNHRKLKDFPRSILFTIDFSQLQLSLNTLLSF